MGQAPSSSNVIQQGGGGSSRNKAVLDKLISIYMPSPDAAVKAVTGVVDSYTNFENGRVQRKALKEGVPVVKCFVSALTTHLQQKNYIDLLSTFLRTMNASAQWVQVLQGSSALEEIGRKIHGELQAQTGLMAAKMFAEQVDKTIRLETGSTASSPDHLYFLYHPDTDWHAEFYDRVRRDPLPNNFLGLSENLDSLVLWMLFLRRHMGQRNKEAWFHLIIPAYRPMLINEPVSFPEELYPLSITGYIHDSKPYVWFDLPNIDNVSPELLDIRHVGNLARPPSSWENAAVAGTGLGGALLTLGLTIGAAAASGPAAPLLAIPTCAAGLAGTMTGMFKVGGAFKDNSPRVLGQRRNTSGTLSASKVADSGVQNMEDVAIHSSTRKISTKRRSASRTKTRRALKGKESVNENQAVLEAPRPRPQTKSSASKPATSKPATKKNTPALVGASSGTNKSTHPAT
ncbi:hypothetical protein BJX61DRAFT_412062 [Aspergillus egyptiacus]|nr:hypothetical protein BJX61DRAFT_412062 [Aspergillus egyptiacus]